MKKKKNENTETPENVRKNKKSLIISIILLLLVIGSCNNNGRKDDSESSISSSESSVAETTTETTEESSTTEETTEKTTTKKTTEKPVTTTEASDVTSQTDNTSDNSSDEFKITSLAHGELLEYTTVAGPLVIKAKIKPSMTNKMTINQNYMNVAYVILNQGGNKFNEIQYWAVADMADGSESKVIQFTLDKNTIDGIYNGNIVDIQLGDYVTDLWILPSLKE
ncbi:MAG: hypothetical protein K2G36_05660 [Ruminococcus sp.]|nr:hypothetical protein [Ruminococcus sp.]